MINKDNFPKELLSLHRWLDWREERCPKKHRPVKVPYDPKSGNRASTVDPATWGTVDEALAVVETHKYDGIGFVLSAKDDIIGIDLDKCIVEGKLNDIATGFFSKAPRTYVEKSPSGNGFHAFIRGKMPIGCGKGKRNSRTGVEIYSADRYFTMTGNKWHDSADEIANDNGVIEWLYETYIKPKREIKSKNGAVAQEPGKSHLDDEKLLQMAKAAKDKEAFDSLWRGAWQGKFPSQSEADFALCRKLAFWSNKDEEQMDRLFRQSGLFREKWDTSHYAGGATYGQVSISRACEFVTETFAPRKPIQKQPLCVYEQNGVYYRKSGDNVEQLTNFIVKPIEMLIGDDEVQLSCDLINDNGKVIRHNFLAEDFTSTPKFKKVLNKNSISFCFFGTDKGFAFGFRAAYKGADGALFQCCRSRRH